MRMVLHQSSTVTKFGTVKLFCSIFCYWAVTDSVVILVHYQTCNNLILFQFHFNLSIPSAFQIAHQVYFVTILCLSGCSYVELLKKAEEAEDWLVYHIMFMISIDRWQSLFHSSQRRMLRELWFLIINNNTVLSYLPLWCYKCLAVMGWL